MKRKVRAIDVISALKLLTMLRNITDKKPRTTTVKQDLPQTDEERTLRNLLETATGQRSLVIELLYKAHMEHVLFMLYENSDEVLETITIPIWTLAAAMNPANLEDSEYFVNICDAFASGKISLPTEGTPP